MAVGPNIFMFDIQTSAKSDAVSRGGRQKESVGADFGALLTQRLQSPAVSGSKAASPVQSKRPGPAEGRSAQDARERSVEKKNSRPSTAEARPKSTEGARRPSQPEHEPQAADGNNLPPEAQVLPVAGQFAPGQVTDGATVEEGNSFLMGNQLGGTQSLQFAQGGAMAEEGLEGMSLDELDLDGLMLEGEALLKPENAGKLLDLAGKGSLTDFKMQLQSLHAASPLSTASVREAQAPLTQYTTSVQVPFQDPKWGEQMINKVLWLSSQSIKSAEIHLNPAELGPVELKIQVHQDQATIQVQAQNASVREALEMHVHRLREALANNGMGLAQFDVSAQADQQQGQQSEAARQLTGAGLVDGGAEEELASESHVVETGLPGLINTYV